MNLKNNIFKAAILEKFNSDLTIKKIKLPKELKKGQVLVKLRYSGICGKQIEEIKNLGKPDPYIPHLLGHEGVATVIRVGPGVKKVKKNNIVILHWMKGSGINSDTPEYFDLNDNKINAGWVTTFNELAVVSENRLTKINYSQNKELLPFLGCAISTGIGVIDNVAAIKKNDRVLVVGCGGVGLFALQAIKFKKPKLVVALDLNKKSIGIAKKLGISNTYLNLKKNYNKILTLTNNKGFDKILIFTGNKRAIQDSFRLSAHKSTTILVGVPIYGQNISIDPFAILHGKTILGSIGGDINPDKDIPKYLNYIKSKKILVKPIINKIIDFKNINDGIRLMNKNSHGRVVIKFDE